MKIQYHKHHIIPRHAGGTDDPSNILKVNTAMHAYLHKCLFEEHGRWQDEIAWKGLSKQLGKQDLHREMITKSLSNPETRLKMRNKKLGRTITQKHADALHAGRRNSKNSEEHNKNISVANTGKQHTQEGKENIKLGLRKRFPNGRTSPTKGKSPSIHTREILRQQNLGKKWWNNGIISKHTHEILDETWSLGRIK